MKKLFSILIIAALLLVIPLITRQAKAVVRCDTQYGEVCREIELEINKEVWDPKDSRFEDDILFEQELYKFAPGEKITFLLKITNVGDETFSKVYVKDTLPEYLELVSGDLEFEIDDLTPGETEERIIEARVVSADRFPDDATICVVNTAETWSGDERDEDTIQVCLEEKVLGVAVLPPTGPEYTSVILALSILSALLGAILLFKAKESGWKI